MGAPISVLLVGRPHARVGCDPASSPEHTIAMLDDALSQAGHRSLVIAPEGSASKGTLLATPWLPAPLDEGARRRADRRQRARVARALRDYRVDLVHMHGADFDRHLPDEGPPVLVTLHAPPAFTSLASLRVDRPATFLHGVSATQTAALPEEAFLLPEIPTGVDLERLKPRDRKRAFALAIGRICPEKGFHVALDAAARAGVLILLAGRVEHVHQRYFREAIAPRLGPRARYLGEISHARKRRLLAAARCVLVPSAVAPASSLVAMEALASGTPVIAARRGALAEIVEHGSTGLLVEGAEEMAQAIGAAELFDPAMCRRRAEERCSAARMTRAYLARYEGVLLASRCAAALAQHGGAPPRGRS